MDLLYSNLELDFNVIRCDGSLVSKDTYHPSLDTNLHVTNSQQPTGFPSKNTFRDDFARVVAYTIISFNVIGSF